MENIAIHTSLLITVFFVIGALSNCAPRSPNHAIEHAESELIQAKSNRDVVAYGAQPLAQAEEALASAKEEWHESRTGGEADHLAYIAARKVTLARETTRKRLAEESAKDYRQLAQLRAHSNELEAQIAREHSLVARSESDYFRERAEASDAAISELKTELKKLNARTTTKGLEVTLNDGLLFESDTSQLKPGASLNLLPVVRYLREHPNANATIEGHTDSVGSSAYNLELSQRRAQAIQGYLLRHGINPSRLLTRGMGEEFPVASNNTEAGRLQNRRVNIIISTGA